LLEVGAVELRTLDAKQIDHPATEHLVAEQPLQRGAEPVHAQLGVEADVKRQQVVEVSSGDGGQGHGVTSWASMIRQTRGFTQVPHIEIRRANLEAGSTRAGRDAQLEEVVA